jgi:hypothetical protein
MTGWLRIIDDLEYYFSEDDQEYNGLFRMINGVEYYYSSDEDDVDMNTNDL